MKWFVGYIVLVIIFTIIWWPIAVLLVCCGIVGIIEAAENGSQLFD